VGFGTRAFRPDDLARYAAPHRQFTLIHGRIDVAFGTRAFRTDDLERYAAPHDAWKCIGCGASLTLAYGDERLGSGQAPRCERCGSGTCPVSSDVVPPRSE
jgi:DNA-directed RNA polymerase subunit RPC12/RpoP